MLRKAIDVMNRYRVIHDYNKLVRRGLADPIKCDKDKFEYITRLGTDDEPVLMCYGCGGRLEPGQRWWENIEKIVQERLK